MTHRLSMLWRIFYCLLGMTLCVFATACSSDLSNWATTVEPKENHDEVSIDITGLFPSFNLNISDYIIRCVDGQPTVVKVSAPSRTLVSIGNKTPRTGIFNTALTRSSGQSFTIKIDTGKQISTHYVRCLPPDFQLWTVDKLGDTQAEWYQIMPRRDGPAPKPYPAIFDNNGVPIWWTTKAQNTSFAQFLPNGNYAYLRIDGTDFNQVQLDGSLARGLDLGNTFDHHEAVLLPNGNLVIAKNEIETDVDLSSWGLSQSESILNHVFLEIDPLDNIVWSWNTLEHISPLETDEARRKPIANTNYYDPYHFNSIEAHATGYIISFRNLNAVVNVNKSSGAILWKLGGTPRSESLTVKNDSAENTLSGQHDARMLPDGTLTVHENGSNTQRPPRALRFQLDLNQRTATVLESLAGTNRILSNCCGSARKLPGGNWVIGYGGTNLVSELASDGSPILSIIFLEGVNIYRSIPIPYGQIDREALRAGMDSQYP